MPSKLNPYIGFRDNAAEALDFYQSVFGGELNVMKFGDVPGMSDEHPEDGAKVMHGQLETSAGFTLMASDTPSSMDYQSGAMITVSVSGEDETELRGYWDKLAGGATVTMPLEKAPWGDVFGMLTDKYGVPWMFDIGTAPQA